MIRSLILYALAALCEIAGCYSAWMVVRLHRSPLWLLPGAAALFVFAGLLTLIESSAAGRAYAAYGAIYIAASISWLWLVEKQRPDLWDASGLSLCLIGAAMILLPHRGA
ncbi:MAG: YnfA family protein [Asticcacaulis sp.]|uniref:YnfA family protein n=1 Tax=Asticcacaulis sp. TaxID=1872648 RepID=UPI003F7BD6A6